MSASIWTPANVDSCIQEALVPHSATFSACTCHTTELLLVNTSQSSPDLFNLFLKFYPFISKAEPRKQRLSICWFTPRQRNKHADHQGNKTRRTESICALDGRLAFNHGAQNTHLNEQCWENRMSAQQKEIRPSISHFT